MKRPALLALLLVAAALPAAAQTRAQASAEAEPLFRKLDRNHDGTLSPAELAAARAHEGNWIAVDRDGDGRISRGEFGVVRDFAAAPSPAAAGGTQPQAQPRQPRAAGRP